MSSRTSRLLLAGLFVAAVTLFVSEPARSQDPLKDAAARQKIELERAQAEFKHDERCCKRAQLIFLPGCPAGTKARRKFHPIPPQ